MLDSTSDHDVFTERISATLGPAAADDWRRLWLRAGKVWHTSYRHVLRSRMDSPLSLVRLAWRVGDLAAIGPGRSLRGLGRSYLDDPHLRVLLDRYATYTGSDPRRAPAALVAIPYAELTFGGWYLRGGLSTLADAVVRRCEALGVRIITGTRVERIETVSGGAWGGRGASGRTRHTHPVGEPARGARAVGVRLASGERVSADVVVANADAAAVYRDLLPSPRRARRLTQRSLGGFVLLLGVRGRTPGLAHHTVFFPPDYDAEFDALFHPAQPVPDPTIFVTVADDPAARPDGYEAWFVLVNAPTTVDWRESGLAEAYADQVLATLARRGVEIRDRLLFREIRTPADLEAATLTPGGAIYGTPSHGLTGLLRPPNRGPVRGLYLVGGSTHPGGGLPMVTLSAEIVAASIADPPDAIGR